MTNQQDIEKYKKYLNHNNYDFSLLSSNEIIEVSNKLKFIEISKEYNESDRSFGFHANYEEEKKVVDYRKIDLNIPKSVNDFDIYYSLKHKNAEIIILSEIVNGYAYYMSKGQFDSLYGGYPGFLNCKITYFMFTLIFGKVDGEYLDKNKL